MRVVRGPLKTAVEVVPGLALRVPVTVYAEDLDGYDVEVSVVAVDGRLAAQEVIVRCRDDGSPVTGEALRAVPVATLVRAAAQATVMREERPDGVISLSGVFLTPAVVARVREAGPTSETLGLVAHVYRVALALGDPPTRAVEVAFEVPRSTAGRWVALARDRGLLGAAQSPGKAAG